MSELEPQYIHIYQNLKKLSDQDSVYHLAVCLEQQLIDLFDLDMIAMLLSANAVDQQDEIFLLSKTSISRSLQMKIFSSLQEFYSLFQSDNADMSGLRVNCKSIDDKKKPIRQMESIYQQPIFYSEKLMGVLGLFDQQKKELSQEQIGLVGIMTYTFGVMAKNITLYNKVKEISITDDLTQIFNKRHIMYRLNEEHSRATRYKTPFSILMLDVDFFKKINDTHGHLMGDAVLKQISQIIQGKLRTNDLIGRYGGEEFIVLLPQTNLKGAIKVASRLCQSVADYPFSIGKITVSIGISCNQQKFKENTMDQMILYADQCLYEAKRQGRNQFMYLLDGQESIQN